MLKKFFASDIPFSNEDTHRYVPWVIAAMLCLSGILWCTGMAFNSFILGGSSHAMARWHVVVPAGMNASSVEHALLQDALPLGDAVRINVIPAAQVGKDLAPWFGSLSAEDALPVPALIEISLVDPDKSKRLIVLLEKMTARFKGISVESYSDALLAFNRHASLMRSIIATLAVILLIATASVVALALRGSIQLHLPIVTMLYGMGAEDRYIIRQFLGHTLTQALRGSLIGITVALLVLIMLLNMLGEAVSMVGMPAQSFIPHILWLAAFPPVMLGLVALLSTMTTKQYLKRLY